ncbi:hypothetical protein ACFL10_00790 [Patescibacteria group bacterium]
MALQGTLTIESVPHLLHGYSDKYCDSALCLVQDLDEIHGDDVIKAVKAEIERHIADIRNLIKQKVKGDLSLALNFNEPDVDRIDPEANQKIRKLCRKFEEKIVQIFSEKSYNEKLTDLPQALNAILKCIIDMRKNVEKVLFVRPVKFEDEQIKQLHPDYQPCVKRMSKFLASPYPFPVLLKPLIKEMMDLTDIKSKEQLARELGISIDIDRVLEKRNAPIQKGALKNAYYKIRNWLLNQTYDFAKSRCLEKNRRIMECLDSVHA